MLMLMLVCYVAMLVAFVPFCICHFFIHFHCPTDRQTHTHYMFGLFNITTCFGCPNQPLSRRHASPLYIFCVSMSYLMMAALDSRNMQQY